MNIIPPVVLTATQLVGGLVASAKTARDLAKDSSNHDLKAAVSDLYDEVLNVKERVLDLDEENRRLKVELARTDEIIGPDEALGYFYFKDRMELPLCPKCYQSQPCNIVFLGPLHKHNGGKLRKCSVCIFGKYEEPPSSGPAIAIGPSLTSMTRSYWG
jgi:hypothetical protein